MCNYYPKHIVEISSPLSIFCIIFNVLFYLLFALFLIVSITKNQNLFSKNKFSLFEKFSQKYELKKIFLVCTIQIVFDLILLSLNMAFDENILYVSDLVTIAVWVLMYSVCTQKENSVLFKKPSRWIIASFVVFMIITSYGNYKILEEYSLHISKYNALAVSSEGTISNLNFLFEIKNFLLDTVVGLVLVISHNLCNKVDEVQEKKKRTTYTIRIVVMIVLSLVLISLKSLILPCSCVKEINCRESNTQNGITEQFYASTKTITISRVDYNFKKKNSFQKTNNKIFYNGTLLYEYASNDSIQANSYKKDGNQIIIEDCFEKNDNFDIELYLYKNEVICFLDNELPLVIHKDDVPKEYNKNLVNIYKELVLNGKWEFFEQAAKYLLEYDEDFINPYLIRVSNGTFDDYEIETLKQSKISSEYIQKTASELCK